MSQGPSLQGQIVINTKSVDQAIRSVTQLEKNVQKAFGGGAQAASKFGTSLERQTNTYNKLSQATSSYQNIIAKAANKVANYEAAVRKSNTTDAKKQQLIKAAGAELKGFSNAVRNGASSGKALANVNTQLSVSLGQLQRDLSASTKAEQEKIKAAQQLEKAQIRNEKAMSTASQQYTRAAAAIRQSGLAEADKAALTRSLEAEHRKLNATLGKTGASVRQVSSAQNRYKETLTQVNTATKNSNMKKSAVEANAYADEMRNLSTSVVMALGPLSGVAARLTALTTLFNRNAASMALVLSSLTGLSVLFARSATYAQEAEKQMFRLNAQLDIMGDTAQMTGDEINVMAHKIANGTLLAAQDVRQAAGSLLEFGGIGRSQFDEVIKAAQGMSVVFGGGLRENIKKLGRAIAEPETQLNSLRESGIILDESTKDLIKTLSAQGRTFEATNVLIEETVSLQKAAEAEAKGLAGAYDTMAGNLDILYESLFMSSGAGEALAASVMEIANAVADFSKSNEAAALGEVFQRMASVSGTAFKFMIDNLHLVAGAMAFIAGSIVPKMIMGMVALATTGFKGLSMSVQLAAAKMKIYTTAAAAAEIQTRTMNAAMLANPFIAVASALTSLVGALWAYNSAMDAIENSGSGVHSTVIGQIENEIALRNDLTKTQVDGIREQVSELENLMQVNKQRYDEAEKMEKDLRQELFDRFSDELSWSEQAFGTERIRYAQKLSSLDSLKKLSEQVTGEEREQVQALISAVQASDLYEQSMNQVNEKAKELRDTLSDIQGGDETNLDLKKQLATVEQMTTEYLEEEAAVLKLRNALQKAKDVQKGLRESMLSGQVTVDEYNRIGEELKRVDRIIGSIRKEMRELNEVEYSKEFVKLADAAIEAREAVNKMQEKFGQSEAQQSMIDLNYEMIELRDSTRKMMEEFDSGELEDFAKILPGVTEAAGIDAVTEAYVRFIRAQKEAEAEAAGDNEAAGDISEFYKSQQSDIQNLRNEYDSLMESAVRLGDATAGGDIAEALQKEKEKMKAEGKEISTTPFSDLERIEEEYEARRELLDKMFGKEEQQYVEHLEKMREDARTRKVFMEFATGAQQASDIVGGAMQAMETAGQESTAAYKAMALGQAVINAALSISQTLADPSLNTYAKIAMSTVIGAQAGAQVAAIQSSNYATGGYVQGPGTGTSDSISANLSNGEFVMRADAVRKIGLENLERMNLGQTPQFSSGGHVSSPSTSPLSTMSSNSGSGINVQIIDQSSGDKEYRTEESVNDKGDKEMRVFINNVVKTSINRGNYDREMGSAYDLKRQGRKV